MSRIQLLIQAGIGTWNLGDEPPPMWWWRGTPLSGARRAVEFELEVVP